MPRRTDPELLAALGARMGRLRRDRGLTQEQVAEVVGLEPLTLSRVENGSRALSVTNMARVAKSLGIRLGELVDVGEELPVPEVGPEEAAWRRMWRAMTPMQREVATRMMREFVRPARAVTHTEGAGPGDQEADTAESQAPMEDRPR